MRELDQELLQPVDRLRFHYGISDGWCPIEFAREIQEIIPVEQIRMDEDGCEHAFVIRDSEIMAQRLLDWID